MYFETAALTGITPAEFERIEAAIQQDGIHVGSDVIALIPENAARAADAVARLQAEAAAAAHEGPAAGAQERIDDLEKRGMQLCAGFHKEAKAAGDFEPQWLIDTFKKDFPGVSIMQGSGYMNVSLSEAADPTSKNFMQWYSTDPGAESGSASERTFAASKASACCR